MHRLLFSAYVLVVCACPLIQAEDMPSPVTTVEVSGVRERLVPYQESYDIAKKVQVVSNGRVALALRLVPAKPDVRVDDVQLWLDGLNESIPIKMLDGGIFVVPINDQIAEQKGSYSINKKKGDLNAFIALVPAVEKNDWTIGLMKQVVANSKNAIDKIVPWYQRPFAMRVDSVAICGKEAGMPLQVMNGDKLIATLSADKKATNDVGGLVFCKFFNGEEKFDDNFRVVVPEGAEALLL